MTFETPDVISPRTHYELVRAERQKLRASLEGLLEQLEVVEEELATFEIAWDGLDNPYLLDEASMRAVWRAERGRGRDKIEQLSKGIIGLTYSTKRLYNLVKQKSMES